MTDFRDFLCCSSAGVGGEIFGTAKSMDDVSQTRFRWVLPQICSLILRGRKRGPLLILGRLKS